MRSACFPTQRLRFVLVTTSKPPTIHREGCHVLRRLTRTPQHVEAVEQAHYPCRACLPRQAAEWNKRMMEAWKAKRQALYGY